MLEEIEISDNSFELYNNMTGRDITCLPLMNEYPDPENTFDVSFGVDGEETGSVDPNAVIGAVGDVAGAIASFKKTGVKADLKAVCGRRPILAKKRASSGWDACATSYQQAMLGMGDSGRGQQQGGYIPPSPPINTGMSTGAKIGIALTIVAVGVGGFLLYKNYAK